MLSKTKTKIVAGTVYTCRTCTLHLQLFIDNQW